MYSYKCLKDGRGSKNTSVFVSFWNITVFSV